MFLYFIPNCMQLKQEDLNRVGLTYLNKRELSFKGATLPFGTGALIGFNEFLQEYPIRYEPDKQDWTPLNTDKSVYIGYPKGKKEEVNLTRLVRKSNLFSTLEYFNIELNDGRVYKFPRAKYLPISFTLNGDGEAITEVSKKYKPLADIANKYTMYEEEQLEVSYNELLSDIAYLLSISYSFGKQEMLAFSLIDEEKYVEIIRYFCWHDEIKELQEAIKEIEAELKKKDIQE